METNAYINNSVTKLQKTLAAHLTQLADETDNALKSKEMSLYLDFCARFYRYSANNVWLILLQRPNASHVAGYHAWLKMGRHVMRGEKGIGVLAPLVVKFTDVDGKEDNRLVGFKMVHVFDVEQTAGEPFPTQPNWISTGQDDELRRRLMGYAQSKGILVTYEKFENDTQGVSMGKKILLNPSSSVKTLAHELAHELLHQVGSCGLSHLEKELEAESTSYIVCRHFGITNLACPNYNALQGATGELILQHFQRIMSAATEIITCIVGNDGNSCTP